VPDKDVELTRCAWCGRSCGYFGSTPMVCATCEARGITPAAAAHWEMILKRVAAWYCVLAAVALVAITVWAAFRR
jgi:hypothetical protein